MKLRFRIGRKAPLRRWFQDRDGTYYRNLPLIMAEQKEVMAWPPLTPGKYGVLDDLEAEWDVAWAKGLIRKAELDPGDMLVTPAPFREVYPDKPGLWRLDDPDWGP
jgi:hypothetical protein